MSWVILLGFIVLLFCCTAGADTNEYAPRRDMDRYISDEEFLAACSVKDPNVALEVRAILADALGLDEHNIHPDDRLVQELGA